MKDLKMLFEALNRGGDFHELRSDIADLIEHSLQRGRDTANMVALPYFINVIGSLTRNVASNRYISSTELHTCLTDLKDAIDALEGNAKPFRLQISSIGMINYDYLLAALDAIRRSFAG